MTASCTFDVFSGLDLHSAEQRMVLGATTYRELARMPASSTEPDDVRDSWVTRMWNVRATVASARPEEPLDWPDATVAGGHAVDVVARLVRPRTDNGRAAPR